MQIRCPLCGEILKISEKLLGKKGICPSCFQPIEISSQNEVYENFSESIQRLSKKGLSVSQIYQKLMQQNLSSKEAWYFLDELYPLLSEEEKLNFNKFKYQKISKSKTVPFLKTKSVYSSLNRSLQIILLLGWLFYITSFALPCVGTYPIIEGHPHGYTYYNYEEWHHVYSGYETLINGNRTSRSVGFIMMLINLPIFISPLMFF